MLSGYHRAMLDDVDDAPTLEPLHTERVYRNYLETCRRLGVEPVSRHRADNLMAEWSDAIVAGPPPPLH